MEIQSLLLDKVSTLGSVTRRQEIIWNTRKANVESKQSSSPNWATSQKTLGYSSSWRLMRS